MKSVRPSGASAQLVVIRPVTGLHAIQRHAVRIDHPDAAMAGVGDIQPVVPVHRQPVRPDETRRHAGEALRLADDRVVAQKQFATPRTTVSSPHTNGFARCSAPARSGWARSKISRSSRPSLCSRYTRPVGSCSPVCPWSVNRINSSSCSVRSFRPLKLSLQHGLDHRRGGSGRRIDPHQAVPVIGGDQDAVRLHF